MKTGIKSSELDGSVFMKFDGFTVRWPARIPKETGLIERWF